VIRRQAPEDRGLFSLALRAIALRAAGIFSKKKPDASFW
jgi:hypothetical protein